jgi:hypothetical protein
VERGPNKRYHRSPWHRREARTMDTPAKMAEVHAVVLIRMRISVGVRYDALASCWSEDNGRAEPPEPVRLQLLQRVFDEALKDLPNGPIRSEVENLRAEAMAPGSTWERHEGPLSRHDRRELLWRRALP